MKKRILHIWISSNMRQRQIVVFGLLLILLAFWMFSGAKSPPIDIPLVSVEKVKIQTIPQQLTIASTLIPQSEVLIRNRIDSQIKEVHFQEGQLINEGDLLFTLDDELLQDQLRQAEANLKKSEAQVIQSEKEFKRNEILLKKGAATQSTLDMLEATMKGNKAIAEETQAQIDLLKLQVSYAQIKSPVTGIAGFVKLQPGTIVRQSETAPLVSIASIDPINSIFDIPERYLSQVLSSNLKKIKIELINVNNKPLKNKCTPLAIDQGVNPKSGVFSLKIAAENADLYLRPGMSVRGIIEIGSYDDAIVVPCTAVLSGQQGSYVFLYDEQQNTVKRQNVKIKDSLDQIVIIESGLKEGMFVITEGQIHLKDGVTVRKRTSE